MEAALRGEFRHHTGNLRLYLWEMPFLQSLQRNLKLRALTVRDYLIKCRTMAMFASIRDILEGKRERQLRGHGAESRSCKSCEKCGAEKRRLMELFGKDGPDEKLSISTLSEL